MTQLQKSINVFVPVHQPEPKLSKTQKHRSQFMSMEELGHYTFGML